MKIQFMVLIPPGGDYDVRGVLPKPPHHPGPLLPSPSPRPGEEGEQPRAMPPFWALPSLPVGGRAMGERGWGSEGAGEVGPTISMQGLASWPSGRGEPEVLVVLGD